MDHEKAEGEGWRMGRMGIMGLMVRAGRSYHPREFVPVYSVASMQEPVPVLVPVRTFLPVARCCGARIHDALTG